MVDQTQIDFFQENGHIYLENLISKDELKPIRKEILEICSDFSKGQKPIQQRDTYGKAFLQMMNLWELNDTIKKFVFNPYFAQIAADLLGVKKVRLYHDQALFKEPMGGPTPWHQDQYYWPLSNDRTITMWMPLVDINDQMGMLTFASQSFKESLPLMSISDESELFIEQFVRDKGFEIIAQKEMNAGDATFHKGWTLHKAQGNQSSTMREVMTIIYMDAEIEIIPPKNEHQEADRKRWLGGLQPGDKANSALNPILN